MKKVWCNHDTSVVCFCDFNTLLNVLNHVLLLYVYKFGIDVFS